MFWQNSGNIAEKQNYGNLHQYLLNWRGVEYKKIQVKRVGVALGIDPRGWPLGQGGRISQTATFPIAKIVLRNFSHKMRNFF